MAQRVVGWAGVLGLAVLGSCGCGLAQEPGYTLRVSAREIVVDVVATDKKGHPLRGLKAGDFEVFEAARADGHKKQAITGFYVREPGEAVPGTGGLQVIAGGRCAEQALAHYQIAYRVSADKLTPGSHEIFVKTSVDGAKLAFGHRYYVGFTEAPKKLKPLTEEMTVAVLRETACFHSPVPLSIRMRAEQFGSTEDGKLKYLVSLPAGSQEAQALVKGGHAHLDYGVCTFNASGEAVSFAHWASDGTLADAEKEKVETGGLGTRVAVAAAGVVYARFAVRDAVTGNVGMTDVSVGPEPGKPRPGPKAGDPFLAFGSALPMAGGFCGDVYDLPVGTLKVPDFLTMESVGAVHAPTLNVEQQEWTYDIPGVIRRADLFGIDYYGTFWVKTAGEYDFWLASDDGSNLFIDDEKVVDDDGIHPVIAKTGSVRLEVGRHTIHVPYIQGAPSAVALELYVQRPGVKGYTVFDLREFGEDAKAKARATADSLRE